VVARRLLALGADVHAVDSHVSEGHLEPGMKLVPLTTGEVAGADVVILLTDHDDVDYDLVTRHGRYVLDTRRRISGKQVEYL
jgi:UDP-N-acetyl-D-glucosamine dehydrogenase